MAGSKKHAYRSRRSHKTDSDMRHFGLYRMAAVTNRKNEIHNSIGRVRQKKGDG